MAPMHLGLIIRALCAPCQDHGSPVALPKLQMARRLILLISSSSKKNGTQVCMSEWGKGLIFTKK